MNPMEIAQTIQKQLIGTLGNSVVWSWGQSALQAMSGEQAQALGIEDSIGALKFKVNGNHHKGHVIVSLNGSDTYDVYIGTVRKNKLTIKAHEEDLFFDEFGEYIDQQVEYIPEYC